MADPTKTYCKYFFNHVALYNGRVANPCCRYGWGIKDASINPLPKVNSYKEILHSKEWQNLRDNSMAGIPEPGCYKCYEEEKNGIKSLRNIANEMFREDKMDIRTGMDKTRDWTNVLGKLYETKLTYIEMNLGNHCNLACNICSSTLSTKWYKDDIELDKRGFRHQINGIPGYRRISKPPDTTLEVPFNADDYIDVETIKFVGGEPMLHPKFIPTIEDIISSGHADHITLQIFTNASWVPKGKLIARLKQFKKVRISLSIDGTEKVNNYSRHLSDWNIVNETARKWLEIEKESKTIQIKWEPTLSIYNANHVPKMFKWWFDLNRSVKQVKFFQAIWNDEQGDINYYLNNVHAPEYLRPGNYRDKTVSKDIDVFLEKVTEMFDESLLSAKIEGKSHDALEDEYRFRLKAIKEPIKKAKSLILEPVNNKELMDFRKYTVILDDIRKKDIKKDLPKLWKISNENT